MFTIKNKYKALQSDVYVKHLVCPKYLKYLEKSWGYFFGYMSSFLYLTLKLEFK